MLALLLRYILLLPYLFEHITLWVNFDKFSFNKISIAEQLNLLALGVWH